MNLEQLAREWIRTDRQEVIGDIERAGRIDLAASYELGLIALAVQDGDSRWKQLADGSQAAHEAMQYALEWLANDHLLQAEAADDSRIAQLELEAVEAGDLEQAELCRLAMRGDQEARQACLEVVLAAEAMRN